MRYYEIIAEASEACPATWFKDSKIVDKAGKPLLVYHATTKEFEQFNANDLQKHA